MTASPSGADSASLAGLASSNGPWLAARLSRLAQLAGLVLSPQVVDSAVRHSALMLRRILADEGRPAATANHTLDPAAQMGRQEAAVHMQAGLDLPGSLRVLRLLRRAYDDLLRESWVDKDSRARAHEDVERFFERTLIGLYVAWADKVREDAVAEVGAGAEVEADAENVGTGAQAPVQTFAQTQDDTCAEPLDPEEHERVCAMLARREDELRRTLDAAQRATRLLRQERERTAQLSALLLQARAQGPAPASHPALHSAGAPAAPVAEAEAAMPDATPDAQHVTALERDEETTRYAAGLEAELGQTRASLAQLRAEAQSAIARAKLAVREAQSRQADQIRGQLTETTRLMGEVHTLRQELAQATEGMERASRAEATAAAQAAALRAELSEALAERDDRIARLDRDLDASGRTVAELRTLLETRQHCQEIDRAEVEASSVALTQLRAEHETALAALRAELTLAREQAESALVESQARQQAAHTLRQERDTLAAQAADAAERQARAERAGHDAEQRASGLVRQLTAAQERLAEAEAIALASAPCPAHGKDGAGQEAQLLAALLAITDDAVAAVDTRGEFATWNARFPALFGLRAESLAEGLTKALPEMARALATPEPFLTRLRELLADPAEPETGLTLVTRGGQTLVLRSLPILSDTAGHEDGDTEGDGGHERQAQPTGRVLTLRDVSAEHDLEDLLREIEAITRYDLCASLTAFIHLPQELLAELALTGSQAEKLTTVRDAGYRLLNAINLAVDLYRMEHGLYRQTVDRCIDLARILRLSAQDLAPLCHSRQVDLELRLDEAPLPPETMLTGPGEPQLAFALLTNLLRDALLGAPKQTTVTASLTNDDIDQCLRLTIQRLGDLPGPMREAFFKKPAPGRDHDGTAKARYAARLLARTLGGSVSVHSGQGQGTTLSLRLPRS